MFPLSIVVVVLSIVTSNGLLLDGSTKSPQAENIMSNGHFATLLTFIFEERKSRERLENVVQQLKQELISKGDILKIVVVKTQTLRMYQKTIRNNCKRT